MPATVSQGSSRAWEALTPSLSEWILDAVSAMGFEEMTPVQASTIPLFIGNKDVVVEAVTGSGKTLAFLIPVVEKLLRLEEPIKKHHVGAVIVSPTRELATQIYSVLLKLLAFHQPSAATLGASDEDHDMEMEKSSFSNELKVIPQLLLGGNTSPAEDLKKFLEKSPNLLISTPGRLVELLGSPYVHTPQSSFEVLVLDEADRLLDLGFKDDLQKILGRLPKQRRTGLFSASVSEAVYEIVRVGLRNPFKIGVKVKRENRSGDKTPASLRMTFLETSPLQKLPAVCSILRNIEPTPQKSIIFFSTCAAVDYFHRIFPSILPRIHGQQIASIPLHGKQPASARTKNFNAFTSSTDPTVLLTTDVAARGLDIPQVDLVVQLDPPTDPKDFLHRCGRAGRAGRKGLAILLLQPGRELDYVTFLQVRKTPVEPYPGPVLTEEEAEHVSSKLQKEVLKDRMLHDKGTQAFVSWVRSYSKHQASSIFRLSDINWTEQARSWGLLQLPKIAEAKSWKGGRSLGVDVDWDNYKYKDKQKEKVRLTSLSEKQFENGKKDGEGYKKRESAAWNANKEVKEKRVARREKKAKKREAERWQGMTEQEKLKEKELKNLIEVVRNRQGEDEEFLGFD